MVGKNNIQNNYLTHTLASKSDYFFHVKNNPGSHVILKKGSRTVVVPNHGSKDIAKGTLKSIMKQAGLL